MLTLETLKEAGADTADGMARCMNNETFYLRLVKMALADNNFSHLREAVDAQDYKGAFECAHALKGMLGNVSLTSLVDPIARITEALRPGDPVDVSGDLALMETELAKYRALCAE